MQNNANQRKSLEIQGNRWKSVQVDGNRWKFLFLAMDESDKCQLTYYVSWLRKVSRSLHLSSEASLDRSYAVLGTGSKHKFRAGRHSVVGQRSVRVLAVYICRSKLNQQCLLLGRVGLDRTGFGLDRPVVPTTAGGDRPNR